MRFLYIILTSFFLIFFLDIFVNLEEKTIANKKQIITIDLNSDQEYVRLDENISFIELEFLDGQNVAYLETENTDLPIRFSNLIFDSHDQDEKYWIRNNFSKVEQLKPSQWIKIKSEWRVRVYWWNEEDKKDILYKARDLWAWAYSQISWIRIISRRQWGAEESLRYNYSNWTSKKTANNVKSNSSRECSAMISKFPAEYIYKKVIYNDSNGEPLLWPYQYSSHIRKIITHHTAESDKSGNLPWDQKMRAIYRYHTLTRRWWDIWYNYVIDQDWKIYEWRAWWNNVVWAHAYCNNIWSMWISLMWNFQNKNPTLKQLSSLSRLIAYLSQKYYININGNTHFHWKSNNNLLWHRDVGSTACPWDNLYVKLPNIRKQIELADFDFDLSKTISDKQASASIESSYWVINIDPTSSKVIVFTYKNTWREVWKKWTWLYVSDNDNRNLFVNSIFADKNYVAADLEEDLVYPWSLWHFNVDISSGYEPWLYSLEFTPIINWVRKLERWTVIQPFNVKSANNSYTFLQLKPPKKEIYFGQSLNATIKLQNNWNTTWYRSWDMKISLKAYPLWRHSDFIPNISDADTTILARLVEPRILPWEIWTFDFLMKAPLKKWYYEEKFIPVIWDDVMLWDRSMQFNINVNVPTYRAQILRESTKNLFLVWEKKTVRIWLKNLSDVPWESEQVALKVVKSWGLRFDLNEYPIASFIPIHQAWFANVTIQAPNKPWKYTATLQALANWKRFERLWRFNLEIEVAWISFEWIITYQSHDKIYIPKWVREKITVRIKNKTNMVWYRNWKNRVSIITKTPNPKLKSKYWLNNTVAALMKEARVTPWNTATFEIFLQNNNLANATYKEHFNARVDSIWTIKWTNFNIEVVTWDNQIQYKRPDSPNTKSNKQSNNTKPSSIKNSSSVSNLDFKAQFLNMTLKEKLDFLRNRNKKVDSNVSTKIVVAKSVNTKESTQAIKRNVEVNLVENKGDEIKVKLSFPENAINVWIIWNAKLFLDKKELLFNNRSAIWARSNWNYTVIVNIDGKKYYWKHFIAKANENSFISLKNWNHSPWWNNNINDNYYHWSIELLAKDKNNKWKIDVINTLSLEDYLKWIAEAPESSNEEKRKAIAVVARTYAMFYTKTKYRKFPWEYYDASDDPNVFQKYLWAWYENRSPKWQESLKQTKWEILQYNWEILKAAYFSCSNWKTRTIKEAWWGSEYFNKVIEVYQSVNDILWKDMTRYRRGQCWHWVWLSWLWAENMGSNWNSYKMILHYYYQNVDIVKR